MNSMKEYTLLLWQEVVAEIVPGSKASMTLISFACLSYKSTPITRTISARYQLGLFKLQDGWVICEQPNHHHWSNQLKPLSLSTLFIFLLYRERAYSLLKQDSALNFPDCFCFIKAALVSKICLSNTFYHCRQKLYRWQ